MVALLIVLPFLGVAIAFAAFLLADKLEGIL